MIRQTISCALFATLLGLFALQHPVLAADSDEDMDKFTLGEVVITGKVEGVEATESVQKVTAQDIQDKGAKTLDQAINLLPGVNVRVGGEGVPRIDVRGFRTRHILLLLNGVPINSAFDQQFDPTVIPTENIAEIKMTKGSYSVLYGQGGLGGVINIITKKGTKGLHGMAGLETGDHMPYMARAGVYGAGGMFDFFLSGSTTRNLGFPLSDGFKPTPGQPGGYRRNNDKERYNVYGNVGFSPAKDLNLAITCSYAAGTYGKPASILNEMLDPFAPNPKYERIDRFENVSYQLAADYDITSRFNIRGWMFRNTIEQRDIMYDNYYYDSYWLNSGSFLEHINTSINGISLQPKYDLGKAGEITLKLSSEWDKWENHGITTLTRYILGPLDNVKSFKIFSTSIQYEVSPLKGLGLALGYGHFWQLRNETNEDAFSALAGIHYDIFSGTRLKASYSRNIRFPTLSDLYNLKQGYPNLVAERSSTFQAGVEQKLPLNSKLSIDGFYTSVKNLIQNDPIEEHNMNLRLVLFKGFEVAAENRFIKGLLLRTSYSYLDSADRARPGRQQQQYTPRDKFTFEGKYDFDFGFSTYASYMFVGNQYVYTKNSVSPVLKAKMSDYSLVNVKLNQKLLKNKINLYLGVNNILDTNYETSYGFPQAGRYIYGGVEFRL